MGTPEAARGRGLAIAVLLTLVIWCVHLVWLQRDSRPPVWDMALHQSYGMNYLDRDPETALAARPWALSGNYPPFVHIIIALLFLITGPGTEVAVLVNLPATFLLLWSLFLLGRDLAGEKAAVWACCLTALIPYLFWMSRETILDYWLSAWLVLFLLLLRRTRGFQLRRESTLLGITIALGLLTKWIFAGFFILPLGYVCWSHRVWSSQKRLINLADSLLVGGALAGIWYIPNLGRLSGYFRENARIGALEGEPRILSFQSFIYYLRLLEGYQLFGVLFVLLALSCYFVWRKRLLPEGRFLAIALLGGYLAMTLLRTKDPRFTMPLLGPMTILCGAWIQSWRRSTVTLAAKSLLVAILLLQTYAINFGVSWLPQEIVIARGYSGSLDWNWNLYLQHYFHILGPPRLEDWKQEEIMRHIAEDAERKGIKPNLALIPDLARFNSANFHLQARLLGLRGDVDHLKRADRGMASFDGFNYVLMTEGDQGMPWTTTASRDLNQIIVDEPRTFRILKMYPLPNGDYVRLYYVHRERSQAE